MAAQEEETKLLAALNRVELVQHVARREEIAEGFRHLLLIDVEERAVHPVVGELLFERPLALRDLVLVVREREVPTAAVDVERHAQLAAGHRGTLDVPTRPA